MSDNQGYSCPVGRIIRSLMWTCGGWETTKVMVRATFGGEEGCELFDDFEKVFLGVSGDALEFAENRARLDDGDRPHFFGCHFAAEGFGDGGDGELAGAVEA